MQTTTSLPTRDILVGGQWRPGQGRTLTSTDPSDGSELARIAGADVADVHDAVTAGVHASNDPAWRRMLPHVRARLLHRVAELIEARSEDLAILQSRDNGKPIRETRGLVASAAGTFRYVGSLLETTDDALTVPRGGYLSMSVHEPIGVVGAITPWNSPIASDAQKLAPALAGGNAVILKPAGWAPVLSLELGALILEAGFPPGLVSVLPGPGASVGGAIVEHPGVGHISFTGGTDTGRHLAQSAGSRLKTISLELGGKSPTIVFDDADLETAVAGVLYGIFSSQGQSCIAGSRLFVQRGIHDEFLSAVTARAEAIVIGEPLAETTQMGPLVSHTHRDIVESFIQSAVREGGHVLTGGTRPDRAGLSHGSYLSPTIIGGLGPTAQVVTEEIFGPVLVVLPFDDEDDLVAAANDTPYGLACGVWTTDFPKAWRVARQIDAGTVWINTYKQLSIATPFGGVKDSGSTREKGREAIHAYQRQKSIVVGMAGPIPWA